MKDKHEVLIRGNTYRVPQSTLKTINLFVTHGARPGSFTKAALENDLCATVGHADRGNLVNLPAIVNYIWFEIPSQCWGSKLRVETWMRHGGLKGFPEGSKKDDQS